MAFWIFTKNHYPLRLMDFLLVLVFTLGVSVDHLLTSSGANSGPKNNLAAYDCFGYAYGPIATCEVRFVAFDSLFRNASA